MSNFQFPTKSEIKRATEPIVDNRNKSYVPLEEAPSFMTEMTIDIRDVAYLLSLIDLMVDDVELNQKYVDRSYTPHKTPYRTNLLRIRYKLELLVRGEKYPTDKIVPTANEYSPLKKEKVAKQGKHGKRKKLRI